VEGRGNTDPLRRFGKARRTRSARLTSGDRDPLPRTVGSIERGRHLPGLGALVSLTRVLHIDPLEILERVDLGHDELSERADRYY
jgi:hypothetical protein